MTHDAKIVSRIRSVLRDAVSHDTDTTLLRAYACWHIYGGQDWRKFGRFISVGNRVTTYRNKDRIA